ncbi:SIS domain-containing protein [Murinocardiopsis flavida]|uniref:Glutamine--fructose-6-phosphate aminotransferase [isomerizing] n=1 Tax=Murinocardiopsis flavida TaxID=645275 RepID=A0A2P8DU06_9ACTN|nr:SIS domain-containing protein [Murinocardiopsis flavida]PSL00682.1 SIS domain-containing protein [Murinocardiopsis flavida]
MTAGRGLMRAGIAEIPGLLAEADDGEAARAGAAVFGAARTLDIVGCGTSLFAGEALRHAFESAGLRTDVREAYEYAAFPPPLADGDALLAISHTGRTPDVVASARLPGRARSAVVAITDEPGSPLGTSAERVLADHRGHEPALPKTRSYISTLLRGLGAARGAAEARGEAAPGAAEVRALADPAAELLERSWQQAEELAAKFASVPRIVVIGGGPEVATANEAALKLTEAADQHADSWQIEEAAHGTWASTRNGELAVVLAPRGHSAAGSRVLAGMRGIGAVTWAIGGDPRLAAEADLATPVPEVPALLAPLLTILPLYCLAERLAQARGLDPDIMRQDVPRYRAAREVMRRSLAAGTEG